MYYFDNAATTRAYGEVVDLVGKYMEEEYFNPSALYKAGHNIEKDIDSARQAIAEYFNVSKEEIYFTPGGTWSNNLVIRSILAKNDKRPIITTRLDHSSIHQALIHGAGKREIIYLANDAKGKIDLEDLKKHLDKNPALVVLTHVNSELGTIADAQAIGKMLGRETHFHLDGVQGFAKYRLDLKKAGLDSYSFSGHKIHGPKGIGGLFLAKDKSIEPLAYGGGQEKGLVSGTENVPGIMGLAKALDISLRNEGENLVRLKQMSSYIREEIAKIPGAIINSPEDGSIYIINAAFDHIKSEVLIHMMSDDGFAISAGSACSKNKKSGIMEAIGLPDSHGQGPIRLSLSVFNTMDQCQALMEALNKNIKQIRQIMKR